jgi:hypothetical protein
MTQPNAPSGWYPDPTGRHELRYFDGQWTVHVSSRGVNSIEMSTAAPAPVAGRPVPPPPPAAGGYPPFTPAQMVAGSPPPSRLTLTATTWLVVLGALGVIISVFLTWATATVRYGFGVVGTGSAHLTGVGRFVGIVVALGVVALSAPAFMGKAVARRRVVGLIAVLAVFMVLVGVWTANAGKSLHGASKETPDVGVFVCWTAIVLIWVAIARLWTQRRKPAPPPYSTH